MRSLFLCVCVCALCLLIIHCSYAFSVCSECAKCWLRVHSPFAQNGLTVNSPYNSSSGKVECFGDCTFRYFTRKKKPESIQHIIISFFYIIQLSKQNSIYLSFTLHSIFLIYIFVIDEWKRCKLDGLFVLNLKFVLHFPWKKI